MTDKQIIIDGVDVSRCEFFAQKDDYCSYSGVTYAYKGQCMCSDEEMCKQHPNCFYKKVLKQLKDKEQECNKLLEFNNSLVEEHKTIGNDLYKEIKEYRKKLQAKEQECEELKKQNNQFDNGINEQFLKIIELEGRNNLLKQTLTEIKEIAEIRKDDINDWLAKEILQKISECETSNN